MKALPTDNRYCYDESIPCNHAYLSPTILSLLRNLRAERVLDVGCGNGALAWDIHAQGIYVVGVDPSSTGINICRERMPEQTFYCMSVYDNPDHIKESDFDAAISTEVIEHLFHPSELVRFCSRKLKSGGRLVLSTPYHGYLKNLALSLLNKWDFHHTALWDGGHIKFWSRKTLTELVEKEGFKVERFIGCGRIPYLWKSMIIVAVKT